MRRFGFVLAAVLMTGLVRGEVPPDAFKTPPRDAYPETWFHFIGGNVAREGIRADLDAIAAAGISGVQFFHGRADGKAWPGVTNQIECLSPNWDRLVGDLADECKTRGLRFTMQNCPGWAMAGGPWITPSHAMRLVCFNRADVAGGARVDRVLPLALPADRNRHDADYRDIAVIAFPTPAGDTGAALVPASVTTTGTVFEFAFKSPVTVRTVELPCVRAMNHGWCYRPGVSVRVEAFAGSGPARVIAAEDVPQSDWQDNSPLTVACDETSAERFRVSLSCAHGFTPGPVRLLSAAHKDNWEAEACTTFRALVRRPPPKQSAAAWIDPAVVTNLTSFMKPDGRLVWDAPAGNWTILRVGHVCANRWNGPAPDEATGLECDKLSAAGADAHYPGYIGRLAGQGGPVHGKLDAMLMDSWECATQTWTPGLDRAFAARSGYDLAPWFPALFGWVVGDPEETTRFLCDWRRLLSDRVTNDFYGRMAEHAHRDGLRIQFETAFGDVLPGDILEYYKYADIPMCEFWQPREENYVGSFDFKPVKPTVSAARMYGKKRVAAEAFTSFQLTWDEKLRDLKYVANLHLAAGITHLIFHTYTHNPLTNSLPPGTSFGGHIGTPFLRGQTWWKFMPEFTAYLARCQEMLESGKPVSDVLWFLGDELDHKPGETAPFPAGYHYDYCNPDALLHRIDVKDGRFVTPDGLSYAVLWMPDCERLRPEIIERLADLAEKGGKIAAARLPAGPATRAGGTAAAARFAAARARLAKSPNFALRPIGEELKALGIRPDVVADGLVWQHRSVPGLGAVYFLAAASPTGFSGRVTFAVPNAIAYLRDPVTGSITGIDNAPGVRGRFELSLDLPPSGSVFVSFPDVGNVISGPRPPSKRVVLAGPWSVGFPAGWGATNVTLDALTPWKDIPGASAAARAFSGTAIYRTTFVPPASFDAVVLDLGRVESLAEVTVNGKNLGKLWCEPYRMDITRVLEPGTNVLEVAVTDTWFNRLVYDAGRPAAERETWTIHGPAADAPLRPSGLLGPVSLSSMPFRR